MDNIKLIENNYYKSKVKDSKGLITFFTPTYNRARFLYRIEECLVNQSCKDFVWIIVNDGSKDDTSDVVMEILEKGTLPILYISKPNGGKHSAFKEAFKHCATQFFQCLDDDDIYYPDAVDFFLNKWSEIKASGKEDIGAIRTLAKHPDGTYSTNFVVEEGAEYDATTIETRYVMKRTQENWTCYDAKKLRSINLFDDYWMSDKHKFFAEKIWQTRFARKYRCRYVNLAFREYRSDDSVSLSRSVKSYQHYLDLFLNEKLILDEQFDLICKYDKSSILKRVLFIVCMRDYLGLHFCDLVKNTENCWIRLFYYITYIPSLFGKRIINYAISNKSSFIR